MTGTVILFIIVYGFLLTFAIGGMSAAPWVPTRRRQREWMVKAIPLRDHAVVYDLGCGDGSILFAMARKNPTIHARGLEIALFPYLIAKIRKWLGGGKYKNVSIFYRNFFKQNLGEADIIFLFLMPGSYEKLVKKFAKELKDDCLVVFKVWPVPSLAPMQTLKTEKLLPIYFYQGKQFSDKGHSPLV